MAGLNPLAHVLLPLLKPLRIGDTPGSAGAINSMATADKPKAALDEFITKLINVYYPWYEKSVRRHYTVWLPLHIVSLFSGFATAILAAIATEQTFKNFSAIKLLLIILPAIGAAGSTVAVQSHLFERYQLRENGRRAIQNLYNEGLSRFAAAKSDDEYTAIHNDLIAKLNIIEEQQSTSFFLFLTKDKSPHTGGKAG
jgi:hypothetical protein